MSTKVLHNNQELGIQLIRGKSIENYSALISPAGSMNFRVALVFDNESKVQYNFQVEAWTDFSVRLEVEQWAMTKAQKMQNERLTKHYNQ